MSKTAKIVLILACILALITAGYIAYSNATMVDYREGNFTEHKCSYDYCSDEAMCRVKYFYSTYYYCAEHADFGKEMVNSAKTNINANNDDGIDMEELTVNLLSAGIVVGILVLYFSRQKQKKATVSNLRYNKTTSELILNKRDASNRKVLSASEIWSHTFNYEPEKMVYTGATVGGIHTGGFHKEGGYHTVSGTSTGKYQVYYDNGDKYDNNRTLGGVDKVILNGSQMVANAKGNSFICQFLQDNTLVLKYGTLSKDDCKRIISWLCGE